MEKFGSKRQLFMYVSMVGGTVYPKGGQCILGYIVRRRTMYPGGHAILLQWRIFTAGLSTVSWPSYTVYRRLMTVDQ